MKTLYFDCSCGAAGDMLSAALYELIDDRKGFLEELNRAGIPHVRTTAEPSAKMGITGTHFRVEIDGEVEGEHHHRHEHEHEHHHHHHASLDDITDIIDSLEIPDRVRMDAINVYRMIAEAEARVHGAEPGEVHFHEVGMLDAVADVVTVCWLIYKLNPDLIMSSPVHTGKGSVMCAHGLMPVPAPATALLLRDIPVYSGDVEGELCTPTGAALLKYFVTKFGPLPEITMEEIGYGMGTKDFEIPNCVRAIIGESDEKAENSEPDLIRHPVSHTDEQKKIILNRLSRVTGHIESIKRMVENNRDANDILVQLAAVESSVNSVSRVIIKSHFKHAIGRAVEEDGHDLEPVYGLIDKFLK